MSPASLRIEGTKPSRRVLGRGISARWKLKLSFTTLKRDLFPDFDMSPIFCSSGEYTGNERLMLIIERSGPYAFPASALRKRSFSCKRVAGLNHDDFTFSIMSFGRLPTGSATFDRHFRSGFQSELFRT
jgi:hypothetical protein